MDKKKLVGCLLGFGLTLILIIGGSISAEGFNGMQDQTDLAALFVTMTDLPATMTDLPATMTDLPATMTDLPATMTDLRAMASDLTQNMGGVNPLERITFPTDSGDMIFMPADPSEYGITFSDPLASPFGDGSTAQGGPESPGPVPSQAQGPGGGNPLDAITIPTDSGDLIFIPSDYGTTFTDPLAQTPGNSVPSQAGPESQGLIPSQMPDIGANQTDENTPEGQDFTDLKVGQVIRMGTYEQDGNLENGEEPIEWKVLSIHKRKKVALVASVYALESMPYGVSGDEEEYTRIGVNWKSCALREWMNEDFYQSHFSKDERRRIRNASNVTDDASGRFTTRDHVFLLSQIEAKRYYGDVKKLQCEATPYVMEKLGSESAAIAEDGYCIWWVREMARVARMHRNGKMVTDSHNEAGYVYGGKGLRMFLRKIGAKTYEENVALVRPAMWIKFDASPKN